MSITDWPLNERPREKLFRQGPNALSEAELLAILLRTGIQGKSALDLARELLQQFKSLHALLNLNQKEFASVKGLGGTKYAVLQAALELGHRYFEEELQDRPLISSAENAKRYFVSKLKGHKQEVFSCAFLDVRHRLIRYETLTYGTITTAPIYPRIIAQKALEYNAAAIILAHNHPSGDLKPSQSDIASTKQLMTILAELDIRVLDHIIVAGNQCCSMTERGLL